MRSRTYPKERFTMRNLKRLELEIAIMERLFGHSNISYAEDGSWIKISNYRLPQGEYEYNLVTMTLQIIIPENYDNSSVIEVYLDRDLRIRKKKKFLALPHTSDHKEAIGRGYIWLCFEPPDVFVSLLDFINTLKAYFTNPFNYQKI